jgi:hypothetical protein
MNEAGLRIEQFNGWALLTRSFMPGHEPIPQGFCEADMASPSFGDQDQDFRHRYLFLLQ